MQSSSAQACSGWRKPESRKASRPARGPPVGAGQVCGDGGCWPRGRALMPRNVPCGSPGCGGAPLLESWGCAPTGPLLALGCCFCFSGGFWLFLHGQTGGVSLPPSSPVARVACRGTRAPAARAPPCLHWGRKHPLRVLAPLALAEEGRYHLKTICK